MKRATEMRELAEKNQMTIQQVMKDIESLAQGGNTMYMSPILGNEVITELIKFGYKISKFTDPMGLEVTRVEW